MFKNGIKNVCNIPDFDLIKPEKSQNQSAVFIYSKHFFIAFLQKK